jgi:hypothetical protein
VWEGSSHLQIIVFVAAVFSSTWQIPWFVPYGIVPGLAVKAAEHCITLLSETPGRLFFFLVPASEILIHAPAVWRVTSRVGRLLKVVTNFFLVPAEIISHAPAVWRVTSRVGRLLKVVTNCFVLHFVFPFRFSIPTIDSAASID